MERSLRELALRTTWVGRRLHVHERIDSTNLEAERLASLDAPEGTLVLAECQDAGRGRLGRTFHSPAGGGLYLSLLLRPNEPHETLHRYVFTAAAAVATAVEGLLTPGTPIEIKWPNDVLVAGRKASGINLPVQLRSDRRVTAVLGIGVNVNTPESAFPPELRSIATSLYIARGAPVDRIAFAEELLCHLERGIDTLRAGGFERVLDCWRKYFRMARSRVRIGGPGISREIEGTVEGIDDAGALLLRTRAGVERILAGDVSVLRREPGEE